MPDMRTISVTVNAKSYTREVESRLTLVDFLRDRMVLRQFKWDVDRQTLDAIDTLEPFYTTELPRQG